MSEEPTIEMEFDISHDQPTLLIFCNASYLGSSDLKRHVTALLGALASADDVKATSLFQLPLPHGFGCQVQAPSAQLTTALLRRAIGGADPTLHVAPTGMNLYVAAFEEPAANVLLAGHTSRQHLERAGPRDARPERLLFFQEKTGGPLPQTEPDHTTALEGCRAILQRELRKLHPAVDCAVLNATLVPQRSAPDGPKSALCFSVASKLRFTPSAQQPFLVGFTEAGKRRYRVETLSAQPRRGGFCDFRVAGFYFMRASGASGAAGTLQRVPPIMVAPPVGVAVASPHSASDFNGATEQVGFNALYAWAFLAHQSSHALRGGADPAAVDAAQVALECKHEWQKAVGAVMAISGVKEPTPAMRLAGLRQVAIKARKDALAAQKRLPAKSQRPRDQEVADAAPPPAKRSANATPTGAGTSAGVAPGFTFPAPTTPTAQPSGISWVTTDPARATANGLFGP